MTASSGRHEYISIRSRVRSYIRNLTYPLDGRFTRQIIESTARVHVLVHPLSAELFLYA